MRIRSPVKIVVKERTTVLTGDFSFVCAEHIFSHEKMLAITLFHGKKCGAKKWRYVL